MDLSHWVSSIVAFVRAGYPNGMPVHGYVPLAALSQRRLSDVEISWVAKQLALDGRRPISTVDVGVAITRVRDQLPSPDEIQRVQRRLDAIGCERG